MNLCDKLGMKKISGAFEVEVCTSKVKGHPEAIDVPINEDRPKIRYDNTFCKTGKCQDCPFYRK